MNTHLLTYLLTYVENNLKTENKTYYVKGQHFFRNSLIMHNILKLFSIRFVLPVNNFSVILGRLPRFNQY